MESERRTEIAESALRRLDGLEQELAGELARVAAEYEERVRSIDESYSAHIRHLEEQITALDARLEEFTGSTSWRVTAPLRKISRLVR